MLTDVYNRVMAIQKAIQDVYARVWAIYTFINDLAAYLLKQGILGPPGVVLGSVLADLWHWSDTTSGGSTLGELVTRMDAISAKLDTALSLLSGGGYGIVVAPVPAGSQSSIGDAVWNHELGTTVQTLPLSADQALAYAYGYARVAGFPVRYPMQHARWFYAELYSDGADATTLVADFLAPDFAGILPSDTVGTWLNRTETTYGNWRWDTDRGQWYTTAAYPGHTADIWLYCTMTEADLQAIRAGYGAAAAIAAPVWPGLAGVTLGTPVALGEAVSIDVPMHGVLVAITGVSPRRTGHGFDDVMSYPKSVSLIFGSDNGDYEYPQVATHQATVCMPRTMRVAAHLRLTAYPDIVGTVTPFTVDALTA